MTLQLGNLLVDSLPLPTDLQILIQSYISPSSLLFFQYDRQKSLEDNFVQYILDTLLPLIPERDIEKFWEQFSQNKNLTDQYVWDHLSFPWNWEGLSNNLSLTFDLVEKTRTPGRWFWSKLSENPHLRINILLREQKQKRNWNWLDVSRNPGITARDIIEHPELPWNWTGVSQNPNITKELIDRYSEKIKWKDLSFNKHITKEIIDTYLSEKWNSYGLSSNPAVTIETVVAHPEFPWNWGVFGTNPNITIEIVRRYPELPWNWETLSQNRNFTLNIVESYPDFPWHWGYLSEHIKITLDVWNRLRNKLDSYPLSRNPTLPLSVMEILLAENMKVNSMYLSENPNLTIDFVSWGELRYTKDGEETWDWQALSENPSVIKSWVQHYMNTGTFNGYSSILHLWTSYGLSQNKNLTIDLIKYLEEESRRTYRKKLGKFEGWYYPPLGANPRLFERTIYFHNGAFIFIAPYLQILPKDLYSLIMEFLDIPS